MTSPLRRRIGAAIALPLLALAGCSGSDEPDTRPASDETTATDPAESPASDEPTETPTESPSDDTSDEGTAVPVYFATDANGGPRLVREFHRVQGDPLTEAARLVMGAGQPDDPDYRTLWPGVEVSDVQATDGVLLVQVPGDGFTERPDGMSRRDARMALQQLVYTLQGVQQERVPVVIQRDGDLGLFGVPSGQEIRNASALKTLNHINITSPTEGATVTGDTLKVTGVVNSFEASGPCRLVASDAEVALEPYQAEGWMEDRLFPFEVELPLADAGTGDVLLECSTDDPSGGAEGNGPDVDTKLITVR